MHGNPVSDLHKICVYLRKSAVPDPFCRERKNRCEKFVHQPPVRYTHIKADVMDILSDRSGACALDGLPDAVGEFGQTVRDRVDPLLGFDTPTATQPASLA